MYTIAVCEDDSYDAKKVINCIEFYFVNYRAQYTIDHFYSGESFVANMYNKNYDIVFFDVHMDQLDGIETARKLREIDSNVAIVFMSRSVEDVFRCFDVAPLNYLLKPVSYEKISSIAESYIAKLRKTRQEYYVFSFDNVIHRVPLDEIIYFESNLRIIIVKTFTREYRFYGKLTDVERQLSDKSFVRCHQSFIVNMRHIMQIDNNSITTTTNERITISRGKTQVIKEKFLDYVGSIL